MLLAAELNSPETTKYLVIGVASFMAIAGSLWFIVSYRRNTRVTAQGHLTPTEQSLNRGHGAAILIGLIGSMLLAVGAVLVPTVRDALSVVGENSRWIPATLIPLLLGYLRWLSRRMVKASAERAAHERAQTAS